MVGDEGIDFSVCGRSVLKKSDLPWVCMSSHWMMGGKREN